MLSLSGEGGEDQGIERLNVAALFSLRQLTRICLALNILDYLFSLDFYVLYLFKRDILTMYLSFWIVCVCLFTVFKLSYQIECQDAPIIRISYSPAILKSYRPLIANPVYKQHFPDNPPNSKQKKRRGRKGGVRARTRRRHQRPVLPVVMTGNARSLNNKMTELQANVNYQNEYRNASIICFSETWFKTETPDSSVDIDNFTLIRGDRDLLATKKKAGGGICAYINNRWCHPNNIAKIRHQCTNEAEILTFSLRPFYIPREFPKVIVNVVYIPPDANSSNAMTILTDALNDQLTSSPESPIFVTGDFNHTTLDPTLPFFQHVNTSTRNDKTIDLFILTLKIPIHVNLCLQSETLTIICLI